MIIKNVKLFEDNNNFMQMIFDMCHPIGDIYVQYPQQDTPEEHYNENDIVSSWEEVDYKGAFFRSNGGYADVFEKRLNISQINGVYITFTENHNFVSKGYIVCDPTHNESRVVVNVSNANTVEINEPFSYSTINSVLISQRCQNKYHNHTLEQSTNNDTLYGRTYAEGYDDGGHLSLFQTCKTNSGDYNYLLLANDGEKTITLSGGNHSHSISVSGFKHKHTCGDEGGDEFRPVNYTIKIWKRVS